LNFLRLVLMNGLCNLTAAALCSCSAPSSAPVDQPIQYNHSLHVQQEEMDCVECHVNALTQARATIPNIGVCGDCHSGEPMTDSPEERKLIEYVDAGTPIPWRKVHRVPMHVHFSHARHTAVAEIECSECHGEVQEMTRPFTQPAIPQDMDRCLMCHKERGVTTDCVACHR
jgi:hypothetical protein